MEFNQQVTALHAALLQLADDPLAMSSLAQNAGIADADVKAVFQAAVEPVIDGLASCERADELVSVANSLEWAEREQPASLLGVSGHRVSREVAKLVYVGPLTSVRSDLVAKTGVSMDSAGIVLKATLGTAVAMAMSDSGEPASLTEVAGSTAVRRKPKRVSVEPGASTTLGRPSAVDSNRSPKTGLLVAGLVLCAALIGGWALFGGSDGPDESQVTDLAAGAAASTPTAAVPTPVSTSTPEPAPTSTPEPAPSSTPEPAPTATTEAEPAAAEPVAEPAEEPTVSPIVSYDIPMRDIQDPQNRASGILAFDFDTATGEVCYTVASVNIAGPYRSHIHVGGADEKGGIVVDLGPLESGATGCVDNLAIDTNAILADLDGHYAELHDVSEEWTIRGQLSEGSTPLADDLTFESESGGAYVLIADDSVSLEGTVADEATALQLISLFEPAGVTNNLQIDPTAPAPSGRVVVQGSVFAVDSASLPAVSPAATEAILSIASLRPDWLLTAVGRTDGDGSELNNLELSLERAKTFRNLLIGLNIEPERLRVRGAGEFASLNNADSRRLEFEFLPPR